MTKLSHIATALALAICFGFTGCNSDDTCTCSECSNNSSSELPDVGFATITYSETVSCFVNNKQYEELRDRYLITVQAEDGSTLRFRTNKDYYERTELEAEGEILVCNISYPIVGTDTWYYVNKQRIDDVWVTPAEPIEQVAPAPNDFSTPISETIKSFTVTDFEHKRVYNAGSKTTIHYYYIYLQAEDGTSFRSDNEDLYSKWTVGDTFDILVQTVDYPIGGTGEKYYLNGERL